MQQPSPRALRDFEDRPGQRQMAAAVGEALASGHVLLCEAGTGTGKTLAYLAPALTSGQRVVISTATKALMDQILDKDLPVAFSALGPDRPAPRVAVAKGLSNYVCRRRFDEFLRDPGASRRHARALPVLERFVREDARGDVAGALGLEEDDPIWPLVTSSPETRIGSKCAFFEDCFVTRMRKDLDEAQLIVTNHHLFFADLALRRGARGASGRSFVLPSYDAVIFDEAHRIEDVASEFFGHRLTSAQISQLAAQAERALDAEGEADTVFSRGSGAALCRELELAGAAFFDLVAERGRLGLGEAEGAGRGRAQLDPDLRLELARSTEFAALDDALATLAQYAEGLATEDATLLLIRRIEEVREQAARVLAPTDLEVAYAERRERTTILAASSVSIGDRLRELVFDRGGAVVMTSATLTSVPISAPKPAVTEAHDYADEPAESERVTSPPTPGPFSFVRQRLGLSELTLNEVRELVVQSPFDYEERTVFYGARDLPEVQDPRFSEAAAERVKELLAITEGGAFVLATSHRALGELRRRLRGLPYRVLAQGDAPKRALLDAFRQEQHAVLLGTQTFWEGVDVPGFALRLVIVDKLPFFVPTDAVVQARSAALAARGIEPFINYVVPAATILLKQGLGRLIRTQRDFGIAAVLDGRLTTRGYGKRMLRQLGLGEPVSDLALVAERYRALLAAHGPETAG